VVPHWTNEQFFGMPEAKWKMRYRVDRPGKPLKLPAWSTYQSYTSMDPLRTPQVVAIWHQLGVGRTR
jgi:hypothetical protein